MWKVWERQKIWQTVKGGKWEKGGRKDYRDNTIRKRSQLHSKLSTALSTACHNNVHSWPLPRPLPRREGEWSPRYPFGEDVGFLLSLISINNSWNVLWYLYAGGLLWNRNSAQKGPLNLWVLWEKKIPSNSQASFLLQWVRSISHRFTQKNRTHKGP